MGMFSKLMNKVFGRDEKPEQKAAAPATAVPAPQPVAAMVATDTPPPPAPGNTATAVAVPVATPVAEVDVTALLDDLAAKNSEKLDWKKSIVDLLKLVGMDSSLSARKELAAELDYSGDTSDSAKMNIWLHKEVIKRIAANGGKVPANLLD